MNLQTSKLVIIAKIALGCFVLYTGYKWIAKRIDYRQAQRAKRTSRQELRDKQLEQANAIYLRLEEALAQLKESASMQDEAEQAKMANLTKLVNDSLNKIQSMQNTVQNNTTQLDALHTELDTVANVIQDTQNTTNLIIHLIKEKISSRDKEALRALYILIGTTIQDAPHWTNNARASEYMSMIQQWAENCRAHYTLVLSSPDNIEQSDIALIEQMNKIALSIIDEITSYSDKNAGNITNEAFFEHFNKFFTDLSKNYQKWSDYPAIVIQTVQWRDPLIHASSIQSVYTRLQTIKSVQTLMNDMAAEIKD
jgi:hypothetical protein